MADYSENIVKIIEARRQHLDRMTNANGAAGEAAAVDDQSELIPRPKGRALATLLSVLQERGMTIKPSSFDAILVPKIDPALDFTNKMQVSEQFENIIFIEIKTANQPRVKEDFSNFFFAITENEISASHVLGNQHKVLLYNKSNGNRLLTSVPDLVSHAKSRTWQLSIQLGSGLRRLPEIT